VGRGRGKKKKTISKDDLKIIVRHNTDGKGPNKKDLEDSAPRNSRKKKKKRPCTSERKLGERIRPDGGGQLGWGRARGGRTEILCREGGPAEFPKTRKPNIFGEN